MKNVGLEYACTIRVDVLDLGIVSMVPRSESESHDVELGHQGKIPDGRKIRSSCLSLGECPNHGMEGRRYIFRLPRNFTE